MIMWKNSKQGFTLFEVMVAMFILAISALAFMDSQRGSASLAISMRNKTVAAMLAYGKIAEFEVNVENKVLTKGIKSVEKKKTGKFKGFPDYTWTRYFEDVKFQIPKGLVLSLQNAFMGKDGENDSGAEEIDHNILRMLTTVNNHLKKTVREMSVVVTWKEDGREKEYSLTTHIVDYNAEISISDRIER